MARPCTTCKKQATIILGHMQPFCRGCYCRVIEKRIKKAIGSLGLKPNERIVCKDEFSRFVLSTVINMPILLGKRKTAPHDKVIVPLFMDHVVLEHMNLLLHKKKPTNTAKLCTPFETLSIGEVTVYCRLKKIPFTVQPLEVPFVHSSRHQPSSLHSLKRSFDDLEAKGCLKILRNS